MNREAKLKRALLALFLHIEEMAVNGYETATYPGTVFNDAIWRVNEPEVFKIAAHARKLLGLPPFRHQSRTSWQAQGRLAAHRAKATSP